MKIYVRGRKILLNCEIADNFLERAKGIMFKRSFNPLLFVFDHKQKISIHSFFCPPFIAIFLDEKKRAVQIEEIKPFSLFTSKQAKYLIEVPINFGKKHNLMEHRVRKNK